jgi:xanthine dehydrogenase accessory factor
MIKGDLAHRMDELLAAREPFVQATVVRAAAPTSVRPGDSALVLADGTIDGFVGGVCAQASVRLHAVRAMETGETILLRLVPGGAAGGPDAGDDPLAQDGVVVVNNPCLSGGALEIFLEPQLPAPRVAVLGDTPVAAALADLGPRVGLAVEVAPPGSGDLALVVASHGRDEAALERALRDGVPYVGLVASRRRGAAVLAALDVDDALRERVRTPAGLDIGAYTAEEIALSILAEIVGVRRQRVALPAPAPATAVDPVCGMEVVADEATVHLDEGGRRVYFCCEGCRSTYAADPLRHAAE